MPAAQKRAGLQIGLWPQLTPNVGSNIALSTAASWVAFSFIPDADRSLAKARMFISSVLGTLGAGEVTCSLYSDSGSLTPGSLVELASGSPTIIGSAAWWEWTGFTSALTKGTLYWLVFKNNNATPASNNPNFTGGAAGSSPLPSQGIGTYGWGCTQTANSGGSWTSQRNNIYGPRVEYADGAFDGFPASSGTNVTVKAFGSQEVGVLFTTPSGTRFNVVGLGFWISRVGIPPAAAVLHLWQGSTLLASTYALPASAFLTTSTGFLAYFSSPLTLNAATSYRITLAQVGGAGDATHCYQLVTYVMDSNANSLALLPLGATWSETDTTNGGSTWSQTNTQAPVAILALDSANPFSPFGGGISRSREVNRL